MGTSSDGKTGLRVLGLIGQDRVGAVDAYRITMPFTYLNSQGWKCAWMSVQTAAEHLRKGESDLVFDYDVIVLARTLTYTGTDMQPFVQALRYKGAKIVYECDDDYTGRYRPADNQNVDCMAYVPHVDAITTSTRPLAKLMSEVSGYKPVWVVPNAIDREWFIKAAQAPREDQRFTIMLAGTQTHYDDWRVMADVIPVLNKMHSGLRFVTAGFLPFYLDGLADFIPPVQYPRYPGVLAQADILCAPLIPDDKFNHSKSAIKAIEGWCAARPVGKRVGGCAVAATDCAAYRGTVQHRHNGLLVKHTPEAWIEALTGLIHDDVSRRNVQLEGHKDSRQYDIAVQWRQWAATYSSIRRLP